MEDCQGRGDSAHMKPGKARTGVDALGRRFMISACCEPRLHKFTPSPASIGSSVYDFGMLRAKVSQVYTVTCLVTCLVIRGVDQKPSAQADRQELPRVVDSSHLGTLKQQLTQDLGLTKQLEQSGLLRG